MVNESEKGGTKNCPWRNITQRPRNTEEIRSKWRLNHQRKESVTKKNWGCHQGQKECLRRRDGQSTEYMNLPNWLLSHQLAVLFLLPRLPPCSPGSGQVVFSPSPTCYPSLADLDSVSCPACLLRQPSSSCPLTWVIYLSPGQGGFVDTLPPSTPFHTTRKCMGESHLEKNMLRNIPRNCNFSLLGEQRGWGNCCSKPWNYKNSQRHQGPSLSTSVFH